MTDKPTSASGCARCFFSGLLPFSPHLLIGLSHTSWHTLEREVRLNKKQSKNNTGLQAYQMWNSLHFILMVCILSWQAKILEMHCTLVDEIEMF